MGRAERGRDKKMLCTIQQEYLSLRQRLAEVFMPTPDLISRFYELEEQAVCVRLKKEAE
jgi:hypothetical protein